MPRISAGSGRRGYYLYEYGTHLWVPETQQDFSLGMFRDTSRVAIPQGGVYDSLDYFLHQPGVAFKRGGTTITGPASGSTYMVGVAFCQFPTGNTDVATISGSSIGLSSKDLFQSQLVGIGQASHLKRLYLFSSSGASVLGSSWTSDLLLDKPKLLIAGKTNLLWILDGDGTSTPMIYGGTPAGPFPHYDAATANVSLTTSGTPTGGNFTIQIGDTGLTGTVTTGTIAWNASSATVQTALNAVSSGYTCSGGSLPTAVTITRPSTDLATIGYPAGQGYPNLTVTNIALTGGTNPSATITATATTSTAPTARFGEVHLSQMVLANTQADPNRVWFGPIGQQFGTTAVDWDTANSYIDAPSPVTGLASLGGTLLVFMQGSFSRIDGDTPPPNTNMSERPVAAVGCTDARSITVLDGKCYFANTKGVYVTTGVGADSLTAGRIESYWQSLLTSYDPNTWSIATGIYARRFLYVTVMDGSGNLVATLRCDLTRNAWERHSRPKVMMYASAYGANEELYGAAARDLAYIEFVSGSYSPSSSNKQDPGPANVLPILETRPFGGSPGIIAFGHGEIAYDMRDAASDNPTMAVQYAKGVEATSYSTVSEGSPLAETTDETRSRVAVNQDSQAVSLKLTQSNVSSKTEIYAVQVDTRSYPAAAQGQ